MQIGAQEVSMQKKEAVGLDPVAGVLCGLVAGGAYIAAQTSFTALLRGESAWAPVHRIAAMLLGPDAATPPFDGPLTLLGIALLIHFTLAIVYGRLVDALVQGKAPLVAGLLGAGLGVAIYVVNFWLVAPSTFPWFEESRSAVTLMDHMIFGAVAAVVCTFLRRRLR